MSMRPCNKTNVPTKIVPRAISAAIAAPLSPNSGTGPSPNIRIGSRATLRIEPMIMSLLGRRVSPVARMLAMPTIPTTTNGTPA